MKTNTHTHTHTHRQTVLIALILLLSVISYGQNFAWLNGSTGNATGNVVAVDQWNFIYVGGAYEAGASSGGFSLPPNISWGIFNPNLAICNAYLTKYDREYGITVAPNYLATVEPVGAYAPNNPFFATIKKMEVDRNGNIHVMGVFVAEELEFYDNTSNIKLLVTPPFPSSGYKKVFIASFDQNFDAYSCHTFSSQNFDVIPGDIAYATKGVQPNTSLFYSISCKGDIVTDQFGVGSPPLTPYDNYPLPLPSDYDIFVGQLDLTTYQVINGNVISGLGDDFAAELTTGYQGYYANESALFLSGTFSNNLTVSDPVLGSVTYNSQGDFDIFAIKFPDFQLNDQLACVAGGPYRDQALCLGDNGYKIGGFMSELADFGTAGISGVYGNSPFTGYISGDKRQVGFIAEADYDNHDWIWYEDLPYPGQDAALTSIAEDNCGSDFYTSLVHGMHTAVFEVSMTYDSHFKGKHLYDASITTANPTDHFYISTLEKWNETGTGIGLIWSHDFAGPTPPFFDNYNIKANFIEDIAVFNDLGQDTVDVVFTGRFGQQIDLTPFAPFTKPWASPVFDGNVGANTSGPSTMFVAALDENPILDTSYYSFCLTDAQSILSCPIMQVGTGTPSYSLANLSYLFDGPGIVDPNTGLFNPTLAGLGTHQIVVQASYFGCWNITPGIVEVEVTENTFPYQPKTENNNWAEGMAVEAKLAYQFGDSVDYPVDHYFLAGQYKDSISFESAIGGTIELVSPNGVPSGYVVAYGPCGALWATNFVSSDSGGYVEDMVISNSGDHLYITGALDGPIEITETNTLSALDSSTNGIQFSANSAHKGFVAQLDAETGQVYKLFLAGDSLNDTSAFHGIDIAKDSLLYVVGEFRGQISGWAFDTPPIALENDVLVMMMDTTYLIGFSSDYITGDGDDRGDAIDVVASPGQVLYHYTGYFEEGTVSTAYPNASPTPTHTIPAGNGKEVFVARGLSDSIFYYALAKDQIRIFEQPGDDIPLDISAPNPTDYFPYAPYHIMISGMYEDDFETQTVEDAYAVNPHSVFGGTGYDAFVMSMDLGFKLQWFRQEGSPFTFDESANALDFDGKDFYVAGKYEGTPGGASQFLNGLPNQTVSGNFVVKFRPNGARLDTTYTIGAGVGTAESNDIKAKDTFLLTAGTQQLGISSQIEFYTHNSSIPYNTIYQASLVSDAYLGRINKSALGYQKKDVQNLEPDLIRDKVLLYPNPSRGEVMMNLNGLGYSSLKVYDLIGKLIVEKDLTQDVESLFLQQANGIYIFEFSKNNGREHQLLQLTH